MDETKKRKRPAVLGRKKMGRESPKRKLKKGCPSAYLAEGRKEKMKKETTKTATSTALSTPCLDFDEILDFVSVKTLDEESLRVLTRVNTHIRGCDECLKLVNAVSTIHEEFARLRASGELAKRKETPMGKKLEEMLADVRALKKEQGGES